MDRHGDLRISDPLPETGDDLVDDKQIRAFLPHAGIVEHQSLLSDSSRDIWGEVQVEQWRYVRPLGRGGFGHVHLEEKTYERFPQTRTMAPQFRAVKIIPERDKGLKTRQHLPEILGMAKFSKLGASFIQLFAWFQVDSSICIAMEWAPYGDLEDCLQDSLPESEVQDITRQISHAILIMHNRRFLHRDLKPKNVFVFRRKPECPEWRVKLGDFGVSKRVREFADTSWHTSIDAECSAPEVLGLLGGDYSEDFSYEGPADMWSLGYLVYWLLTKHYPVPKRSLPQYCMAMNPLPLTHLTNKGVTDQALDFVQNLLHLSPAKRMTAAEAYHHPWLSLQRRSTTSFAGGSDIPRENDAPLTKGASGPYEIHQPTEASDMVIEQNISPVPVLERPSSRLEESQPSSRDEKDIASEQRKANMQSREVLEPPPDIVDRTLSIPDVAGSAISNDNVDYNAVKAASTVLEAKASHRESEQKLDNASAEVEVEVKAEAQDDVEAKVLDQFQKFAMTEKARAAERKRAEAASNRQTKLNDLRRFHKNFRLKTEVPTDLVGILAKDPAKQQAIIERAQRESKTVVQEPTPEQKHHTAATETSSERPTDNSERSHSQLPAPRARLTWAKIAASGLSKP